ncbi:MAG: diguanylate cyclase [Thermoleophilaceae bacterium]
MTLGEAVLLTGLGVLVTAAIAWWAAKRHGRAGTDRLIAALENLKEQNRLLAETQTIGLIGSWEHDYRMGRRRYSGALLALWGFEEQGSTPTLEQFTERVASEDRERTNEIIESAVADREPFEMEYRIRRTDGDTRILHCRGRPFYDDRGDVIRLAGTAQDVTTQRAEEAARAEAEELFRRAFEDAPIGMSISDLDGRYRRVNGELASMVGYSPEQLTGKTYVELIHPDDLGRDHEAVRALVAGERASYTTEKRYIHAEGHVVWVSFHAVLVRDRAGAPAHLLAHAQDITDRRAYERELRHLADHDPLTGVLNRRALEREIHDHMARVERYGPDGALLMLDMDNFKRVNDTLGHSAGDELMVRVARRLRSCLRESDVLARLGGDEFAVLLPQANTASARMVARKLCEGVRAEGLQTDGARDAGVTASVGGAPIAAVDGVVPTAEKLMHAADRAMYQAKFAGRDGITVLAPEEVLRPSSAGRVRPG